MAGKDRFCPKSKLKYTQDRLAALKITEIFFCQAAIKSDFLIVRGVGKGL